VWSSGQSYWLQIWRPGFDSRHYQKKVVGLERGPSGCRSVGIVRSRTQTMEFSFLVTHYIGWVDLRAGSALWRSENS
jgi:hypothetical protein